MSDRIDEAFESWFAGSQAKHTFKFRGEEFRAGAEFMRSEAAKLARDHAQDHRHLASRPEVSEAVKRVAGGMEVACLDLADKINSLGGAS